MNRGILYGLCAYGLWGLLPIYWKALGAVPAQEILAHRVVWALLVLTGLLTVTRRWQWIRTLRTDPATFFTFVAIAFLLGTNWFTYIWAVNAGFVVETSLGYFITPLINVLMGVLLLRERVRPLQWVAVGLAGLGVLYLTVSYGSLPWIALVLAFTFSLYGLVKKQARLSALEGLSLEMAVLFLPALGYLLWLGEQGQAAFGSSLPTTLLLAGTGIMTAVPLLCFAGAARRIPLSTLGFLQYLAPTLQFLLGVLLYKEPFTQVRMIGFGIIWIALALYSAEGYLAHRRRARQIRYPALTPTNPPS